MTNRTGRVFAIGLAAFATLMCETPASGQADNRLPTTWQHWRYFAAVDMPSASTGLIATPLNVPASAHQSAWQDLRVIDEAGKEVPFVVHARLETSAVEARRSRLLEVAYVPGESTQGIVDLGEEPAEHNAVELSIDERDYFVWVEVAVSTDGRVWRILNERSPIYRFSSNGLDGNQTVRYSPTRSRYLRLRLLDGSRKLPLVGVRVSQVIRHEAERTRIDVDFALDPASPANEHWWRADMGDSRLPGSELRVDTTQAEFHRALRVRVSDDGKEWRTAGQGDIFRISSRQPASGADEEARERLYVRFQEAYARYWRVEVFNRNDPPLTALKVALFGTPRRVVFRADPDRRYRVVFGNPRAEEAQYEMARLTPTTDLEAARPATIGSVMTNSEWVDSAPWSERHPVVLWAAVLAAVAVLGTIALQALRTPSSSPPAAGS